MYVSAKTVVGYQATKMIEEIRHLATLVKGDVTIPFPVSKCVAEDISSNPSLS
jgi:hypothetical protein